VAPPTLRMGCKTSSLVLNCNGESLLEGGWSCLFGVKIRFWSKEKSDSPLRAMDENFCRWLNGDDAEMSFVGMRYYWNKFDFSSEEWSGFIFS